MSVVVELMYVYACMYEFVHKLKTYNIQYTYIQNTYALHANRIKNGKE